MWRLFLELIKQSKWLLCAVKDFADLAGQKSFFEFQFEWIFLSNMKEHFLENKKMQKLCLIYQI